MSIALFVNVTSSVVSDCQTMPPPPPPASRPPRRVLKHSGNYNFSKGDIA